MRAPVLMLPPVLMKAPQPAPLPESEQATPSERAQMQQPSGEALGGLRAGHNRRQSRRAGCANWSTSSSPSFPPPLPPTPRGIWQTEGAMPPTPTPPHPASRGGLLALLCLRARGIWQTEGAMPPTPTPPHPASRGGLLALLCLRARGIWQTEGAIRRRRGQLNYLLPSLTRRAFPLLPSQERLSM